MSSPVLATHSAIWKTFFDNSDGAKLLSSLEPRPSRIIDMSSQEKTLVDICLQETGGLGVDCVVDDGGM